MLMTCHRIKASLWVLDLRGRALYARKGPWILVPHIRSTTSNHFIYSQNLFELPPNPLIPKNIPCVNIFCSRAVSYSPAFPSYVSYICSHSLVLSCTCTISRELLHMQHVIENACMSGCLQNVRLIMCFESCCVHVCVSYAPRYRQQHLIFS